MSGNPPANAGGKSDDPIVPKKAPNKAPQGVAEGLEGRGSIKENIEEPNPSRTPRRGIGSQG